MFRKTAISLTALSCLTLGFAGVATSTASAAATHVLTLEGNTGVTFTNNFNPMDSSSFAAELSVRSLVNEPLFEFDTLKANTQYPWLATSYAFSDGGKAITFNLRHGVKWSNGTAFTSADVAYTFDLLNKVPAANVWGDPTMASNATTSGAYSVTLHYSSPQYLNIPTIAGSTLIVSKAGTIRPEQLLLDRREVQGEPELLGREAGGDRDLRAFVLDQHDCGHRSR